ncbi:MULTISPECIES: hypothetical protein [Heyndrickxia]|uniref:Uncharacterized protein n=1 Tax=Heyndrickxia coagulans 36D1 TaxID=345219 RepID=G2TK22_HEYCO|nr:hypothetical protein [Heyndrickxia coagulans]AEP01023.1 hypothetical protein Bcoa_1836 [Heyndrickxia coagulans 36D1]KYC61329.1 hypothetical protein B4100_1996 [Heyndrickxia coagulans]UZH05799.1 hypothetical protein ONG97_13080 [Heyndrickxia coagulans]
MIKDDFSERVFDNASPLNAMAALRGILSEEEELAFMNLLFSSSASIRGANFGLSRKEVEKQLKIQNDNDAFFSFLTRVNQAVSRYFQVIYDERRDQVVVMMRVPARAARNTLSKESLALLLYMFYQQEVLQHEFSLFGQLLEALGHETKKANQRIQLSLDQLKKIGAIEEYEDTHSDHKAYQLTAIGVHMFSDSFLRRTAEFSQSNKLNKEEVLKFFKRYNLYQEGDAE